jgi:hypothetical protein
MRTVGAARAGMCAGRTQSALLEWAGRGRNEKAGAKKGAIRLGAAEPEGENRNGGRAQKIREKRGPKTGMGKPEVPKRE